MNLLKAPKSLYSYNPIPNGCVLYLPLWSPGLNGSAFKSIDPYRRECTVTGALQKADGRYFDGADDYVDLSASIDNFKDLTIGTIIFLLKTDDNTLGTQSIISMSHTADGSSDCSLRLSSGQVNYVVRDDVTTHLNRTLNTTLTNGQLYHIALTVGVNSNILYQDAVAGATTDATGDNTTQKFFNNILTPDSFLIGMSKDSGGYEWDYEGHIKEAWIYNSTLSAGEITYHMNAVSGRM